MVIMFGSVVVTVKLSVMFGLAILVWVEAVIVVFVDDTVVFCSCEVMIIVEVILNWSVLVVRIDVVCSVVALLMVTLKIWSVEDKFVWTVVCSVYESDTLVFCWYCVTVNNTEEFMIRVVEVELVTWIVVLRETMVVLFENVYKDDWETKKSTNKSCALIERSKFSNQWNKCTWNMLWFCYSCCVRQE